MKYANSDRLRRFEDLLEHEAKACVPQAPVPRRRRPEEVEQARGDVLLEVIDRVNHPRYPFVRTSRESAI
jgi:hypothetical protein